MSGALTEAMAKVVEVLTPLESDQRKRVVQAAFALLGEATPTSATSTATGNASVVADPGGDDAPSGISPAGSAWLARAKITKEQLEHYLHFDGGKVKVIALPGGATKRIDQVINAYLMCGFAAYLEAGDAAFTDQDARSLCEHEGCYDPTNHAKYLKEFGNRITGSKSSGWKLTAPGIAAAGALIKA